MELPHLGQHCSNKTCNKLDFLPIKCDACHQVFCDEHYKYSEHNCSNSYKKNNKVPVCPLCNIPIPIPKGQHADAVVGNHIDSDCQSDPAKSRRKVFTNKCSMKKCKTREVIKVICPECSQNFCLKHRHTTDHNCQGQGRQGRAQRTFNAPQNVQGSLSEDEALARALALSLQETKKQEEVDLAMARQLQAEQTAAGAGWSRDKCNVS